MTDTAEETAQALTARQQMEEVWGDRKREKKGEDETMEDGRGRPSETLDDQPLAKYRRDENKGKGQSQASWSGMGPKQKPGEGPLAKDPGRDSFRAADRDGRANAGAGQVYGEARDQARARAHASATGFGVCDLRRYFGPGLPQDAAMGRGVVAGEVRTGHSEHSPQNGPRHVAPEAPQGEDGGGAGQRPAAPEVPGGRLAGANGERTEPELGISYLGPGEKVPDCGPGPSTEARGVPPQDRHAHREPAEGGSLDQVLNAEGAAGELRDGGDPFQLDVEFAGNLERSVLPSTPGPERMCGDEDGRAQNATRAHQQAPSGEGGRGRVYGNGNAAVRLEKSQLARQSVEARVGLGRPPVEAARRDAQLLLHEGLHLPAVQPVNSSNLYAT